MTRTICSFINKRSGVVVSEAAERRNYLYYCYVGRSPCFPSAFADADTTRLSWNLPANHIPEQVVVIIYGLEPLRRLWRPVVSQVVTKNHSVLSWLQNRYFKGISIVFTLNHKKYLTCMNRFHWLQLNWIVDCVINKNVSLNKTVDRCSCV